MPLKYRLALDLGSTSLGWAVLALDDAQPPRPKAIAKAGVRIFSDGRNPKDGSSLAVTRRDARAMRRRRDRLLKRKARMMHTLIEHGFFPADAAARKKLETVNPYSLRAKGLDEALKPEEFARALFHINQRRGFKSNRKTDKKDNDSGALKTAINKVRLMLKETGCRTVGEWLNKRHEADERVRARYRQKKVVKDDGKTRIDKSYDLYIDRAMIEAEFDVLWAKQSELNPALFNETARYELKDCLLHQRPLKPVKPGRCTLLPDEERAPSALPSTQRFRIYQELNNLRILREGLKEEPLTLQQRNELAAALDQNNKCSFTQIKKLLGLGGAVQFNFEDPKRQEFKGNVTNAILRKAEHFGEAWMAFDEAKQDAIVLQLVKEENEAKLIAWLIQETGIDEKRAEAIANPGLPKGYGSLSAKALKLILPELRRDVVSYAEAAKQAGFHHSVLSLSNCIEGRTFQLEKTDPESGEIKIFHVYHDLPYYGEPLQRRVGFGTGNPSDTPEKRYGKIANPTVHIGLNQVRLVVNALIKRYGHPDEVIVELARELKQSKDHSIKDQEPYKVKPGCPCQRCVTANQAANQIRNKDHRSKIAKVLKISEEQVAGADLKKMVLWEELSFDPANRRCPYSGVQISAAMLLSDEVEIEHILPFSQTLDDSLNNKTVAMRQANRVKGNNTPWEAFGKQAQAGFDYQTILQRAELMPKSKRYRFAEDGLQRWLKDDKGFLARALNDTKHLSKVAREYVSLICPQNTRVIPGQMTAMLRGKFGLNDVLSLTGEKNRNDHRHHAVDACVIGVTDQPMLQRFAQASASTRERQLNKLVDNMPLPWDSYREHVQRAVNNIWISHKPEHGYESAMHEDTAWGLRPNGEASRRVRGEDGKRQRETKNRTVIPFSSTVDKNRHGCDEQGFPKSYKGYVGGSNFCMDIVRDEKGKWESEIISTYDAYQVIRTLGEKKGLAALRSSALSISGKPLAMRLQNGDAVKMVIDDRLRLMRVVKMGSNGQIFFAEHQEANVSDRNANKQEPFSFTSKYAGSLQKTQARRVTVSALGEVADSGFKE
jgi:CRISPR-associated endonuclease Csn1